MLSCEGEKMDLVFIGKIWKTSLTKFFFLTNSVKIITLEMS